jgi:hypothetical protein
MAGSVAHTGFGVGFADFDNDGNLDLYVANGRVKLGATDLDPRNPYAEANVLMRGLGGGRFSEVRPEGGTEPLVLATGRGLALGDLDNDGGIDAVVVNKDGPARLLRNQISGQGSWLEFRVVDREGRDIRNAIVQIDCGGKFQWRQVQPNEGYCSSNDPRVHFGADAAKQADHVRVRWPNDVAEEFGPLATGRIHELRMGRGQAVSGAFPW